MTNSLSLTDSATSGVLLFNYLLSHERRYGFQVLRMLSSDSENITTEFVLAKQWPHKNHQRYFHISILLNHTVSFVKNCY